MKLVFPVFLLLLSIVANSTLSYVKPEYTKKKEVNGLLSHIALAIGNMWLCERFPCAIPALSSVQLLKGHIPHCVTLCC
jgi:hypothetical protein